ncbi:MAG: protein kinase domain-containing protein [Gemmatimonadaceae bacterium]
MNPQLLRSLADRYTIERELGCGGMATVYLALDARHHRRVAVKVLHPELSAVIGSERFLKEIEVTAGLQHPHILPLFDSGDVDGQLYYVMPFVEGETLRTRLEREKQLPVDDAIRIATEVASALEYAHKRHVVHRDIKPENILLHDGAAVVADFGIALAVQDAGGERMTQTGLSLGTPQYMAPEQAMGDKSVGPRADIYALGAVTYEMLVGEPPFTGTTAQAIVAKMLTDDPAPPSRQRRAIPPTLEGAVLRALEKLPADRWPSAQAFADAMMATHALPSVRGVRPARAAWLPWSVAAVAAALAAVAWLRRPPAPAAMAPSQLSIVVPGAGAAGSGRLLNISPDGERIVYSTATTDVFATYVQELMRTEPALLPALQSQMDLHIGRDSRTVYFGDLSHTQLTRASIDGGLAVPVRGAPSASFIADAPDGSMWVSTPSFEIFRVAADGTVQKRFESAQPKLTVAIMQVFEDGRSALAKDYQTADGQLYVMDLESGRLTPLLEYPIVEARYAVGLLVYVRSDGSLYALPFDAEAHKPTGSPTLIGENVSLTGNGVAQFAVASNGTTVYTPAQPRQVMLVDRAGVATVLTTERRNFHMPRFSPDGQTIALDFPSLDGRDVWTLDRATHTLSRVTSDHDAHDPVWTRDGRELFYTSIRRGGGFGIYRTRPGSGVTTKIAVDPRLAFTGVPMPDGKTLIAQAVDFRPGSRNDVVRIDSAGHITAIVADSYDEGYSEVSPDGRWLAYTSTLSGRYEVYVRALEGDADQVQISTTGGSEPMWSRDGRELFYRAEADGHQQLVTATVDRGPPFRVTSRRPLFSMEEYDAAQPHANYDVSPDGKSFVMIHRAPTGRLTVIQNLPELVRRLSGNKRP